MAFDLATLREEPFACVSTTIGELCVFAISYAGQQEVYKELDNPTNEYKATDFVRKYARYVCFPKISLKEGKYKPDKLILDDNAISSLTDDDLETIAKLYIENSEYLFKKVIFKEKTDDQGIIVNYEEYGGVEYPKTEKESCTQYLLRLSIKDNEKQKKQMEKMLGSLSGVHSFSNALEDSIKKTLTWGDSLRKTMESIRPMSMDSIRPVEPVLPSFDFVEIDRIKEERRLKPFNELADRLDQLVNASEFMIDANKTQIQIARAIKDSAKDSADETTKLSKKNISRTSIVILLTVFGLIVSIYTIRKSVNDGNMRRIETRETVNLLAGKLTEINNNISVAKDQVPERLERKYAADNELLKFENENLKTQAAKQSRMIDEMKVLIVRQGKKLEELEKKLKRTDQKN